MNRTPSNLPQDVLGRVMDADVRPNLSTGLHCAAATRIIGRPNVKNGSKRVLPGGAHA